MSGAAITPLTSTIKKRTLSVGMPTMLLTTRLSRSISTSTPITIAVMSAASSKMMRTIRFVPDLSVGGRGELRTRSIQEVYSAATVWIGSGSQWSIDAAALFESLISKGVVNVVTADTAIATGYIHPPITFDATPTLAMMHEN